MTNLKASEIEVIINNGVNIELTAGFTIEDIIQDLHDNANIGEVTVYEAGANFTIVYNPEIVDKEKLIIFLEGHEGVRRLFLD